MLERELFSVWRPGSLQRPFSDCTGQKSMMRSGEASELSATSTSNLHPYITLLPGTAKRMTLKSCHTLTWHAVLRDHGIWASCRKKLAAVPMGLHDMWLVIWYFRQNHDCSIQLPGQADRHSSLIVTKWCVPQLGPLLRCPRLFLLSCFVCLCPWRYLPFQPKVVVTRVTRWRGYAINLRQKTPKMHCFPLRKPSSMHVGFLTRCARKCQGFTRHPGTPGMPRKALVRSEFESTQPTQHKMQTVFGGLRPARPATRLLCRCHSDTVVQKFLRMMNRVRAGRIFFLTLCSKILFSL